MDSSDFNKIGYLQAEIQNTKLQFRTSEQESHNKSLQINTLKQQIDILQNKLVKYREGNVEKDNLIREKSELNERVRALEIVIAQKSTDNEALVRANNNLSATLNDSLGKLKDQDKSIESLTKEKNLLESKIVQLCKDKNDLIDENNRYRNLLSQTESKNEILQSRVGDFENYKLKYEISEDENSKIRNEIIQLTELLSKQNERLNELKCSLDDQKITIEQLREHKEEISKKSLENEKSFLN